MIAPRTVERGVGPTGLDHKREPGTTPALTAGEILTMPNGEVWFHPYNGSRPTMTGYAERKV